MSVQFDAAGASELTVRASDATLPLEVHQKPKRDLKKMALIAGLSLLAWISTYTGMLELIQANLGEVGLVEKVAIGMAVAMLQIMIVWLLDQMFSPIHATIKAFYIVGYLFLTLISVGFAFGFYWKVLESRSASTSSAETSISSVGNALRGAETRLDQLVSTLELLTTISTQKAEQEASNGNSCPGSKPGAGPRMAMRRGDAEKFSFASNFVKGRSEQVKGDIKALDVDLQRILKDDKTIVDAKTGTRNDFLRGMGRKLEETTTRYNALRTDPQLRQIRQDAAERAEKTTFPDTRGGTYACPDGQLQSALRGVVAAIDQLPTLEKAKIAATEGSEAVIEAFRRLTTTLFGAFQLRLPPTPEELREKQAKAVQSMESPAAAAAAQKALNLEAAGLGKRDYIPLGIAIFVDFCLLMVSFGRPANRFARTAMELKAAELGPQSEIVGINREVHEDRIIRRNFELLQHVVIHFGNHYLAAVPLTAPRQASDGRELTAPEREKLQTEAQMLVTLFAGLELNSAIVDRGLPPFVHLAGGARLVRRRLIKQESKFARAGAFRFYRFRNRAWPELILGTVMGTAKRYQEVLAQRRAEEAEQEKEQRRLDAEQRRAENAQRKAENAQRIAEAELRTIEAQRRQREVEEHLRRTAEMRRAPYPRPAPASAQPYPPPPRGAQRPAPMPSATIFPVQPAPASGAMHAAGPPVGPAPIPFGQGYPAGTATASPGLPPGRPPQATPAAFAPATMPMIEPANHNTAPPDRPLPANVVPMPDRYERGTGSVAIALPQSSVGPSAAPAVPQAQGASALALAVRSSAETDPAAVPELVASIAAAVPAVSPSQPSDLASLLKTVAVTQIRVAQDVAAAVQRIESGADTRDPLPGRRSPVIEAMAEVLAESDRQAASSVPGPAPQTTFSTSQPSTNGIGADRSDGLPAGRGLAHDPRLDDVNSFAARYAPQSRQT